LRSTTRTRQHRGYSTKEAGTRTARLRRQTVDRVVRLAVRADLATEGEVGAGRERVAVLVDVRNCELDGGVVLRSDEAACRAVRMPTPCARGTGRDALVAAHLRGT
jgi:hypothetical protein